MNTGSVPFGWEQNPGRPKNKQVKTNESALSLPKVPLVLKTIRLINNRLVVITPNRIQRSIRCMIKSRLHILRESAMLRLDMSEYMQRHTINKLIGSPPGYVGCGEGGTLTEAIRKCPFTVILLDEIEKAHPDIFNILLQIFEDGYLTDSQGRRVLFENAL
ncbi:putative ClpA/B family, ATPase, AAA-type, core, P-loop containing nucleoside triphosphate hydrolase [Helianthus annuus]|nr:putative ClpA/B family, ATPase, AAA-type, core, P-loop containing nucleoside triphosphate hydrolase [Helianthus annuus]